MLEPESPVGQRRGPVGRLWARVRADHSLSKRASLNMVASMLDYAARIVVGFLLNPLLVTNLGDVTFGVYQVLARLIGWATPAGGRPSQALKWTIARHQHSDRYEEKRLQVGSAVAVWFLFLPPLVIAGGVLAWFAPDIVNAPQSLYPTIRIAAGLLVLELIADQPPRRFHSPSSRAKTSGTSAWVSRPWSCSSAGRSLQQPCYSGRVWSALRLRRSLRRSSPAWSSGG